MKIDTIQCQNDILQYKKFKLYLKACMQTDIIVQELGHFYLCFLGQKVWIYCLM